MSGAPVSLFALELEHKNTTMFECRGHTIWQGRITAKWRVADQTGRYLGAYETRDEAIASVTPREPITWRI